ncbi:MAG: threonine aldolase, partial [Pseudomonas sp.]|nr:threonine aldolase [Pseudomonas sp.]
ASVNGKLTPQSIREVALKRQDIHYPKPRVVTITQATEVGTVYRPNELKAISATCKELGLNLHMDGARFTNACAFLGCSPAELTWKAGVDVLCFGGTKNGMAVGEAILFFNRALAEDFDYRCKQAGQLASKMRFLSAPWVGLLEDGAWMRHGKHANHCAQLLASLVSDLPEVELMFPVEANGVFLQMPEHALEVLRNKGWRFYTFIGSGGARFMCSWDTQEARVRELAADIRAIFAA